MVSQHSDLISELIDLDLEHDQELKEIVELASSITASPYVMISIINGEDQHVKVSKGISNRIFSAKDGLCSYALQQENSYLIEDASKNDRLIDHPALTEHKVRFYAGIPLILQDGQKLGTFCFFNTEEQALNEHQQLMLKVLSNQVVKIIQVKIGARLLGKNKAELEEQILINNNANIRLRSFFESSTNFQVLLGKEGEVIDFNKTAYNFIKAAHQCNLQRGDYLAKYIHPDFLSTFIKQYNLALRGERSAKEGSTDYDDLGTIWWEASFDTATDSNNQIIGVSYIIRNVTERKLKEQKIIAQNQSLLKIAHIQAHDFRAPLTTIMGLTNLIKEEFISQPSEYIDMLGQAVNTLDITIRAIINNIDNIVVNDFAGDLTKN